MTDSPSNQPLLAPSLSELSQQLKRWGQALGFAHVGITDVDLSQARPRLQQWLEQQYHGDMDWMASHGDKRTHPDQLEPGTLRVISARMDYLPEDTDPINVLRQEDLGYVSRYALGRDYHKKIRKQLAKLAEKLEHAAAELGFDDLQQRAFVDSAPVLEKPLAEKAGLGWMGKHTLIIHPQAGSYFFLGEIYTSLPLPTDNNPVTNECGECTACMKVCPTDAFPEPYVLDARRCISYLTIEHKGSIPEEFREPMGNRVFGCDDCQLTCPWNKPATHTTETDFSPRNQLQKESLINLFLWTEEEFLKNTEGSPIRRIGHERWLRNLAIALGNAPKDIRVIEALNQRADHPSPLVLEHIHWALARQQSNKRRKRKIRQN